MFEITVDIVPIHVQLEFFLRVVIAAIFGAAIGYERKNRLKEAGVRTHLIVCLGSALIMVVSKYGFSDIANQAGYRVDPTRIASQIVSGIGFLGAGMIFVRKQTVNGLTTAAGVWATAGVGMAIGSGLYFIGMISAVLIIFLQVVLHKNADFFHIPLSESIEIKVVNRPDVLKDLRDVIRDRNIEIVNIKVENIDERTIGIDLLAKFPHGYHADEIMLMFNNLDYIISVEL
jgi:putative Mg2+ transporter-C (MgtC) family protein